MGLHIRATSNLEFIGFAKNKLRLLKQSMADLGLDTFTKHIYVKNSAGQTLDITLKQVGEEQYIDIYAFPFHSIFYKVYYGTKSLSPIEGDYYSHTVEQLAPYIVEGRPRREVDEYVYTGTFSYGIISSLLDGVSPDRFFSRDARDGNYIVLTGTLRKRFFWRIGGGFGGIGDSNAYFGSLEDVLVEGSNPDIEYEEVEEDAEFTSIEEYLDDYLLVRLDAYNEALEFAELRKTIYESSPTLENKNIYIGAKSNLKVAKRNHYIFEILNNGSFDIVTDRTVEPPTFNGATDLLTMNRSFNRLFKVYFNEDSESYEYEFVKTVDFNFIQFTSNTYQTMVASVIGFIDGFSNNDPDSDEAEDEKAIRALIYS